MNWGTAWQTTATTTANKLMNSAAALIGPMQHGTIYPLRYRSGMSLLRQVVQSVPISAAGICPTAGCVKFLQPCCWFQVSGSSGDGSVVQQAGASPSLHGRWSQTGGRRPRSQSIRQQPANAPPMQGFPVPSGARTPFRTAEVATKIRRQRMTVEAVEREHETHGARAGDHVLKKEEFHVAIAAFKQHVEGPIPRKHISQGTLHSLIMAANALEGQVNAISDRQLSPRAPLIVALPLIFFAGNTMYPPIVQASE
jgi:hypothetical protein